MPPPSPLLLGREGRRESEKEDSYLIYTRLFKSPREFLTESRFVIGASDNSAAMLIHILLSLFLQAKMSEQSGGGGSGMQKGKQRPDGPEGVSTRLLAGMESAPPSPFRSVQLPVKSRSSNFLLALRPQRPARCWAFFNRAERSPSLSFSLSVSVSHSMLCSQAFRFPRQSLERTKERTKSVCPVPLPPMSALLSISASSLLSSPSCRQMYF